ncbi:hypothetical protein L596_018804 [Steinernema carpocapsae]|uniref:Uncharacterized protein n=1 Tax=Steinernema carpocapsae TaxID=34508 RepID=A0A4U5N685_STECR|nr:hypothetical protein L596_018804 [Steinernema carpocapsae]
MSGATAVVTTVALQMDLSLANISAAGKLYKSMDLVRAVSQSNVSTEASNPSQKTMRKELYRIWITYARGVLGCNNSFMSLHVWRVEIPAFLLKYIIDHRLMSGR